MKKYYISFLQFALRGCIALNEKNDIIQTDAVKLKRRESMRKRFLAAILAGSMIFSFTGCQPKNVIKTSGKAVISSLTVDYLTNPVGIDSDTPLFSWNMADTVRGQKQTAYQIMVSDSYEGLLRGEYNVWDSGRVESDQSLAVPYAGNALTPGTRYYWQVQVWDKDGKNCLSQDKCYFETGLMEGGFSDAQWILQTKSGGATGAAPIMRKIFKLDKSARDIESARIYATAAGLYELYLNGDKLGDDFLNPGSTQYDQHVLYQTYDVTELLKSGENTVSAQLGNGWWAGMAGLVFNKQYPAFISKTVIKYKDGSVQTVVTDGTWEYTTDGPITENDIYNGETYVATRTEKEYDYEPVTVQTAEELGVGEITSQIAGTIKCMQVIEPVNITEPEHNVFVYDFGQNMAGVVEITVKGEKGTVVTIRHGEVLNNGETNGDGAYGTLYTANLRAAQATDKYVCAGTGEETWHPSFTFHGFRYAEISGIDWEDIVSVKALVLYTDMDDTSSLVTSNEKVNKLERNAYWGMRSNFLSVPTDCPSRNERFGYLGDAQVFCGTSMYYMDTAAFYNQYIMDILDCTQDIGIFPNSAPGAYKDVYQAAHGAWADGGIIIPYTAYVRYGDITTLEECYPAMQRYIEYMKGQAGSDYIRDNMGQYGDWLNANDPTPVGTVDTAYCAYTTSLMADVARWLGKDDDSRMYEELSQKYKDAWVREYMNSDGSTVCNSQTSYVLALYFDIVPDELREACAAKLAELIRNNGNKLTVGFIGVSYLLPALCDNGYTDVAFDLLLQEDYPSWFYQINKGATTIWERWDAITTDNSFQDVNMNSFNHFAFGSVMEWGYAYLGGIKCDTEAPGFKHFILQPCVGGGLTSAQAEYDSMYGLIKSAWTSEDGKLTYTCTVPANTTATLYLPASSASSVSESGGSLGSAEGITVTGEENGCVIMELQSGTYTFTVG